MTPRISVIIPTYNCTKYLPEAITGVLRQTCQDFEIVIIDDGSIDNTHLLVNKYIRIYPNKIKYFYQKNKGPSAARNNGIKHASGEYVAFLDADDIYMPEYLEQCFGLMTKHNNAYDLVVTEWMQSLIDDNGIEMAKERISLEEILNNNSNLYKRLLKVPIFNSYMFARKQYLEKIGEFDEHFFLGEDWDMWRRFAYHKAKIGLIKEPLFIYRKRKNSLTTQTTCKKLKSQVDLIHKYEKDILVDCKLRKYYAEVLWDLARQAFYLKASPNFILKCIIQSQLYKPSLSRILKSFCSTVMVKK